MCLRIRHSSHNLYFWHNQKKCFSFNRKHLKYNVIIECIYRHHKICKYTHTLQTPSIHPSIRTNTRVSNHLRTNTTGLLDHIRNTYISAFAEMPWKFRLFFSTSIKSSNKCSQIIWKNNKWLWTVSHKSEYACRRAAKKKKLFLKRENPNETFEWIRFIWTVHRSSSWYQHQRIVALCANVYDIHM